ncbi:hypothetical protein EVAR_60470_1 [Eumeta japonica]|uniref:Uncharacterized protein n=1 Tax=Eumeta variegata TaxID=151549 RepID=A0A4C1ZJ62_EUMVA|nr:hypothetical protein EVAR_60470_1 [Eumeta japonica]
MDIKTVYYRTVSTTLIECTNCAPVDSSKDDHLNMDDTHQTLFLALITKLARRRTNVRLRVSRRVRPIGRPSHPTPAMS